jgi:hypothetical protein
MGMANRVTDENVVIADTVTKLGPECDGRVVLAGSHGGVYAAYCACKARALGVLLNDAGRGMEDAGTGGGAYCEALSIPYATIDTYSAIIGNGEDMAARGTISHANPIAETLGVTVGMAAMAAARLMSAVRPSTKDVQPYEEARLELPAGPGERVIVLMDSISLVREGDDEHIIVSGSHGGMLGTDPATAVRGKAYAAFFNDAGGGIDGAGITRLPALDSRGIAAGTVDCMTARIGDGRSTYEDGVLSHVNETAAGLALRSGMTARSAIDLLAGKQPRSE